ncbi:Copper Transporter integral membrane protein that functions in high affinity copper transport [Madurella fahalii]|uniref:Copper transport protein n=1 Tax=Madurella fahalii TaxID=1157608 RepID=A0ABQ0GCE0_9PEZI
MRWNWNTIDSCFISSTWYVTSSGMFAGSCIGVILLVMTLKLLHRSVNDDRFLLRRYTVRQTAVTPAAPGSSKPGSDNGASQASAPACRPTILELAVRPLLHMAQFAVAYLIML